MKALNIFWVLLVSPLYVFAQLDSVHKASKESLPVKNKIYFNAGIGESTLGFATYGIETGDHSGYQTWQSLVYNSSIEYGFLQRLSAGVAASYQTETGVPANVYQSFTNYTENITRLNIGLRVTWYIVSFKHFQWYIGIRQGASFWTDKLNPVPINTPSIKYTMGSSQISRYSLQAYSGIRLVYNHIGFHAECGIGTPYFGEIGISFIIGNKEK